MSPAYVQKLERGEVSSPSPHKLRAVADALEIPFDDVMRLAGYAVDNGRPATAEDSVSLLAQALQAEDLTADELEDLSDYLHFRRRQRNRNS